MYTLLPTFPLFFFQTMTILEMKSYGIKIILYAGYPSRFYLKCAKFCHLYSLDNLVIIIFQGKMVKVKDNSVELLIYL